MLYPCFIHPTTRTIDYTLFSVYLFRHSTYDCCMVCTSATYGLSYSQLHAVLRHKPILCPQGLCGVTYDHCYRNCSFNQQQTLKSYFGPTKGNSIFSFARPMMNDFSYIQGGDIEKQCALSGQNPTDLSTVL